jgi:transposase
MGKIYVGIDWADDHHDIYITDDSAAALDSLSIPHSHEGMEKLISRVAKCCAERESVLVAIESHQGLLIYALLEAGYLVYPINPKAMNRYRDRYRMSSSKSDPKDAMVLANILRTDLHLYKPLPRETVFDARLRHLTRSHKSLGQQKTKLLNQLTNQLKSYYPVALRLFSRLDHKITLAFLERFPSPEKAMDASLEDLGRFFREQSYSHQWRVNAIYESLHEPSLRAPVELEEIHETIVLSLVAVLRSLVVEMEKLAVKINEEFEHNPAHEVFSSLPTGELTAARINGELGSDGTRYPSREYLQTSAGTAPVTRRSGKSIVVFFRWQCNKHLRAALQDLARDSVKRCPWAKEYFAGQMKLGHKPSRAYRALANRWAAIIWKMLQTGQHFDQSRLGKHQAKSLSTRYIVASPRAC